MKENEFYKIVNADGKCWLMPVRGMCVGLALYQPSGWKGRMLKKFLPWLHWSRLVRLVLKIDVVEWNMPKEVRDVVCEVFDVEKFDYSVFGGTPSVHQKTTIQVWNEERILGYVKLTESEEVGRLFFQEMNFLKKVNGQRSTVNGLLVPETWAFIIHNSQFTIHNCERLWVLIQTTTKSLKSEMVREWGLLQEGFVEALYEATAREIVWEDSDLARALRELREHVEWLPDGVDGEMVAKRIDAILERMANKSVKYGAYHADFTPWNMFVEQGKLFVFDWEYSERTYPQGLDRYHFWMQTSIFEKHWGVKELMAYMASEDGVWVDRKMLELYLLDVMSRYVMREGRKVKEIGLFGVWYSLLKEL